MDNSVKKQKKLLKGPRHLEIYLDYAKMHSVLKLNGTIQRGQKVELANIWQDLTTKLNDCGGPIRDVKAWKKAITEWKSHTRRKLRENRPLNDMEKKLVELDGIASNLETGIKKPSIGNCKNILAIKEEIDYLEDESDTDTRFIEETTREESTRSLEELQEELRNISRSNENLQDYSEKDNDKQLIINIVHDEHSKGQKHSGKHEDKKRISNKEHHKRPKNQNISHKETRDVQSKHTQNSKDVNNIRKKKKSHSGISGRPSCHVSTQVNQSMLEISEISESVSTGTAIHSLSNAINRYCDIVERRIF